MTSITLRRTYVKYIIPSMLTMAAISLSEFADSMLVAHLLGSDVISVIQTGSPVMLIIGTIYMLLGNGGATNYAICLGQRDYHKAGKTFASVMMAISVVGLLLMGAGFLLFKPLSEMLCADAGMRPVFAGYLRVLILSVPFIAIVLSATAFLPPAGMPQLATVVNVAANVINICMDYVYIQLFHMGIVGAAWATLTGYLCGGVIIIFACLKTKLDIRWEMPGWGDFKILLECITTGSASAVSQFGLAIRNIFCNGLAVATGGPVALKVLSLCYQSWSIVTIFVIGVIEAACPILAMLHGREDRFGERGILKKTLLYQFLFSVACAAFFALLPKLFAGLYSIRDPESLQLAVRALRAFSLMYLVRGFYMTLMRYMTICGYKGKSLFVSIVDALGVLPISAVLCRVMGIDGLWWSFPLMGWSLAFIGLFFIRSLRKELESDTGHMVYYNVVGEDEAISKLSKEIGDVCLENGVERETAVRASLLIEEAAIFLRNRMGKNGYMDISVVAGDSGVKIDIRESGAKSDPNEEDARDIRENMLLIRNLSKRVTYDYNMGMNNITIELERNNKK